jgi:hypothetical protein
MAQSIAQPDRLRHHRLPDVAERMAKVGSADVRKADDALRIALGRAVRRVRGALSLKEFAAAIDRDERQVARWEDGTDRPHFDALFAVDALRQPLVLALAELADIEIVTQITLRRRA